jgi:tetratricopeptide (TPR) repeat protein
MFKYVLVGLVIFSITSAQNSDSLINAANELFETRHVDPENLEKSRDILQGVLDSEPDNVRALYELSKVYYQLGDEAEKKDEKLKLYNAGKEYSKKAKKLDDNSADAHFWYVVNLGRIGQTKGVLHSLGSVPEIKKEIDKILDIDSTHTGALDVKAMLYYELPGLFGGNLNKSMEALNKAIAFDSNYALLYVDMGKVYIKKKDYEKARWYLNKVLEIENPTYEADYILDDKPDAVELLKEIEEK